MGIYCNGRARIKHNESGKIYEIRNDELGWETVGGDERQMGLEIHYEAVLDHLDLGDLTWSLWEYPVGIENYSETNAAPHDVLEDFDYGLKALEQGQEWLDYAVPDKPFEIFMDSFYDTGDMLADYGKEHGAP